MYDIKYFTLSLYTVEITTYNAIKIGQAETIRFKFVLYAFKIITG
jgi:hypothetical protein